jgi:hypothetical protein
MADTPDWLKGYTTPTAPKPSAKEEQTRASTASDYAGVRQKGAETGLIGVKTQAARQTLADKAKAGAENVARVQEVRQNFNDAVQKALTAVAKIKYLSGPSTTGVAGDILKQFPTQAADLNDALTQLKAINFKAVTDQMKASSKTGATGLGRILATEIPFITGQNGVLDQNRMVSSVVQNADRFGNSLRRIYAGVNGDGDKLFSSDPKVRQLTMSRYGIVPPGQDRGEQRSEASAPLLGASADGNINVKSVPVSQTHQTNFENYVHDELAKNGKLDPDAYAKKRDELGQADGRIPADAAILDDFRAEAKRISTRWAQGVVPNLQIPPNNVEATQLEKLRAETSANPIVGSVESALAGAATNFTKPFMSAEQSNRLEALKAAHPEWAAAGSVASGIGTAVLGGAAGIPTSAINTGQGALAGYDPNDPLGSTLRGGAEGLVLGKAGELAGKAVAGTTRAAGNIPAFGMLNEAGVPLTIGELGGKYGKAAEGVLAKIPVVGAALRARQAEGQSALNDALAEIGGKHDASLADLTSTYGTDNAAAEAKAAQDAADLKAKYADDTSAAQAKAIQDAKDLAEQQRNEKFALSQNQGKEVADLQARHAAELKANIEKMNQDALDHVVAPTGMDHPGTIGNQGVKDAQNIVSDNYKRLLTGVDIPVNSDAESTVHQIIDGLSDGAVPDTVVRGFESKVAPIFAKNSLSGDDYQQLLRVTSSLRNAARVSDAGAYYPDVADATRAVEDTVGNLVQTTDPKLAEGLHMANLARRRLGVVEDASANSAGTTGGHPDSGVFDADTLHNAMTSTARKFGSVADLATGTRVVKGVENEVPFFDLANEALADAGSTKEAQKLALLRTDVKQVGQNEALAIKHGDQIAAAKEAANKAADDLKSGHESALDTAASEGDKTVADLAEQYKADQAALTSSRDTSLQSLTNAYGDVKNAPPTVSGSWMKALGIPGLIGADVGLEHLAKGDKADDSGTTARDIGLAALAAGAPNAVYSKLGQRILTTGIPALEGTAAGDLARRYLPATLSGGVIGGVIGGEPNKMRYPGFDPSNMPIAQLPMPNTGNIPPVAPDNSAPQTTDEAAQ